MTSQMSAAVFARALSEAPATDDPLPSLALVRKESPRCAGPHDVVIRVVAAGLCQTDLHLIDGNGVAGVRPFVGMALGHENAGEVVEVGAAVRDVRVGDYVLCYPFVPVGDEQVGSAPPANGQARRTPGISHDGGFATFLLTDERCLVRVPDESSCRALVALTDAGLAAFNAVERVSAHVGKDSPVVIIGLGGLGHLGIQFARALGLVDVRAIEPREAPREWARRIGIEIVYESVDQARSDLHVQERAVGGVVDFVGSTETSAFGVEVLGFAGIYVAVGVGGELQVSVADIVERGLTIQGAFVGSLAQLRACVDVCQEAGIQPLIHEYALTDINQAIVDLRNGHLLGRAVVNP